jgi:hypothetical protein
MSRLIRCLETKPRPKSMIVTIIAMMAMIDSVDNVGSDFDADRVSAVPWPISICFARQSTVTGGSDILLLATCTAILHRKAGAMILFLRPKRWK